MCSLIYVLMSSTKMFNLDYDWLRIFYHNSSAGAFPNIEATVNFNSHNENAERFSILDQLDAFRNKQGLFHLKLCYPSLEYQCQEWTQRSNPVDESDVIDFTPINIGLTSAEKEFNGLGKNLYSTRNLMDDRPTSGHWSFSLGVVSLNEDRSFYGPWVKVHEVVLYVRKGKTSLKELNK